MIDCQVLSFWYTCFFFSLAVASILYVVWKIRGIWNRVKISTHNSTWLIGIYFTSMRSGRLFAMFKPSCRWKRNESLAGTFHYRHQNWIAYISCTYNQCSLLRQSSKHIRYSYLTWWWIVEFANSTSCMKQGSKIENWTFAEKWYS